MRKTHDPIDRHVGARIRLRRNMLGISQEKLAEGLGLSFQQVQKYEKGANRVGASRLQHIAAILNTPISFFFEEGPNTSASASEHLDDMPTMLLTSKDCLALARAFVSIKDKTVQQKVLSLVRALGSSNAARDELEHWVKATP